METLDAVRTLRDDVIQTWLRRVNPEDLALALVGADSEVKTCVFRNLSSRAQQALDSDITAMESVDPPHADRTRAIRTVLQHL